jgi:hypothetical protein
MTPLLPRGCHPHQRDGVMGACPEGGVTHQRDGVVGACPR